MLLMFFLVRLLFLMSCMIVSRWLLVSLEMVMLLWWSLVSVDLSSFVVNVVLMLVFMVFLNSGIVWL